MVRQLPLDRLMLETGIALPRWSAVGKQHPVRRGALPRRVRPNEQGEMRISPHKPGHLSYDVLNLSAPPKPMCVSGWFVCRCVAVPL